MRQVTSEILDRQPPCDELAEQSLIGCLVYEPACWPKVQPLVDPSDFYGAAHSTIAEVVWNLFANRITPDPTTILGALKSHRQEPSQPAWAFVIAEAVENSTGLNAETYARSIREKATLRKVRDVALDMLQRAYDPAADAGEIIESAAVKGQRLKAGLVGDTATTLERAAFAHIETLTARESPLVELGVADLDQAVGGGVERGELIVLAARPSHGKSAVALQAVHTITAIGYPALIISEEMSDMACGKRAIQFATPTAIEHWRSNTKEVIADVSEHFHQRSPAHIVRSAGSSDRACDLIRRYVRDEGVKMVVVDYAQLISGAGKTRYEQITNMSIAFRQVTSECNVILLLLCQLNREIEKRDTFTPKLSDLRDSGQFEQDADVIVFMVWPRKLDNTKPANEYQFFVAKNRNRPIVTPAFQCVFEPSRQMFSRAIPEATPFNPDEYDDWNNR